MMPYGERDGGLKWYRRYVTLFSCHWLFLFTSGKFTLASSTFVLCDSKYVWKRKNLWAHNSTGISQSAEFFAIGQMLRHKLDATFSLRKPIDSYWFKMYCYLVFICVHCFFLKMMKFYKDNCSAWISGTSAKKFFS